VNTVKKNCKPIRGQGNSHFESGFLFNCERVSYNVLLKWGGGERGEDTCTAKYDCVHFTVLLRQCNDWGKMPLCKLQETLSFLKAMENAFKLTIALTLSLC